MPINPSPHQGTGLSAEKLQLFAASLSGLSAEEVAKTKRLYLKNEISQLRMLMDQQRHFFKAQGCLGWFPLFRPIVKLQRSTLGAAVRLQAEQITNALDVWAGDLGEREVAALLDEVKALQPLSESPQ